MVEAPALSAKDLGADGMLGVDALRDTAPGHGLQGAAAIQKFHQPGRTGRRNLHHRRAREESQLWPADPGQFRRCHSVPLLVVLDSGFRSLDRQSGPPEAAHRAATPASPRKGRTHVVTATGHHLTHWNSTKSARAEVGGNHHPQHVPWPSLELHTATGSSLTRRQPGPVTGHGRTRACARRSAPSACAGAGDVHNKQILMLQSPTRRNGRCFADQKAL